MIRYNKTYNWLLRIIGSIKTIQQCFTCANLLNNFLKQYKSIKVSGRDYYTLSHLLMAKALMV